MEPLWLRSGVFSAQLRFQSPTFPGNFKLFSCWTPENPWGIPAEDLLFPAFDIWLCVVWMVLSGWTPSKKKVKVHIVPGGFLKTKPKPTHKFLDFCWVKGRICPLLEQPTSRAAPENTLVHQKCSSKFEREFGGPFVEKMPLIWNWLVVSTPLKNISQTGNLPENRGENKTSLKLTTT